MASRRPAAVCSVEKRMFSHTSRPPGITFVAPVPACTLVICRLLGGKKALPSSQERAARAARAGRARWIGLSASWG